MKNVFILRADDANETQALIRELAGENSAQKKIYAYKSPHQRFTLKTR